MSLSNLQRTRCKWLCVWVVLMDRTEAKNYGQFHRQDNPMERCQMERPPTPSLEELLSERKTKSFGNGVRPAPFPTGLLEVTILAHFSMQVLKDARFGMVAETEI